VTRLGTPWASPAGWWAGIALGGLLVPAVTLVDRDLAAVLRPAEMSWLLLLAQWGTWLGHGLPDIAAPPLIGLTRWWRRREDGTWQRGLLGGVAVAAAGAANTVVKNLVCRARPSGPDAGSFFAGFPCFPAPYAQASFPSGHTATAFALAVLLSLWYPRGTAVWLALAGGVAWSRVALGSHFPSDVLAGAALGSAAVLLLSHRWPRLRGGSGGNGKREMGNAKREVSNA
jgi:membrane-associated phospholipid phosphatase